MKTTPGSPSRVTGVLPARWTEDSTWQGANVTARYSQLTQGAPQGGGALRIEVDEIGAGRAQLRLDDIHLSKTEWMKMRLAMRSPTSSNFRLGIRKAGPPFNDYWTVNTGTAPEWGMREFFVPPVTDDPNAQLVIYIDLPLVLEIDDFSLEYISREAAQTGRDYDGNLLLTSSFPQGLARPWTPDTEGLQFANYQAVASTLGPTGLPSLRVNSSMGDGRPMAQFTTPFMGKPGDEHTTSVWLRGKPGMNIHLRLGPPSAQLWLDPWQKTVTLSEEWQRFTHTVRLPFVPEGFYLWRITTHDSGAFWVDGAQVEVGAKAGEFRRGGAVELALYPRENFGLHLMGEPLTVNAAVVGKISEGATLRGKLVDLNNKEYSLDPVTLKPGDKLQNIELSIPNRGEPALGTYILELTAHNKAGDVVSQPTEVLLHRVRAPRKADEFAPNSPFGIHLAHTPEHVEMAQRLGFKWVRPLYATNWSSIETEPGKWQWEGTDRLVNLYHDRKFSILGVLSGVPRQHSMAPETFRGWNFANAVVKPESMGDWQEYARRIGERYRGKIAHWETWNEPDLASFFFQDFKNGVYVPGTPTQIAAMTAAASKGLKAADPKMQVFWNSASPQEKSVFFLASIKAGILNHVDGVTYHHYYPGNVGFPVGPLSQRIDFVRASLPGSAAKMPLWNSEGGPGPAEVLNNYRHIPPTDRRARAGFWADYVVRYWVESLAAGADKFFLYLYARGSFTPNYDLLNADGSLAPNAVAVSNLAWDLEGKRFAQRVPLGENVNAFLFTGGGDTVAVVLSQGIGRIPLQELPVGIVARDLYGNDLPLPTRLGDSAVFLTGKAIDASTLVQRLSVIK